MRGRSIAVIALAACVLGLTGACKPQSVELLHPKCEPAAGSGACPPAAMPANCTNPPIGTVCADPNTVPPGPVVTKPDTCKGGFGVGCADAALEPVKCANSSDAGACIDPAPVPVKCIDDAQCAFAELCRGICTPCPPTSCPACAPGTMPSKNVIHGCAVCDGCVPIPCKAHAQCGIGALCFKGICQSCDSVPTGCDASCLWDFKPQYVLHNGCKICECAPPNECFDDAGCGPGEHCYMGQQCDDGCKSPSCCHGNRCSVAGCSEQPLQNCSRVGCANGRCSGSGKCSPPSCKCLAPSSGWYCEANACEAETQCIPEG